MPVVYSKIDLYDVKVTLKRMGYGFHSSRGIPLQLNVESKTRHRKTDGVPLREPLRAITQQELDIILRQSESIDAAVILIEQLSRGEDLAPMETLKGEQVSGLSAEQISHLIDNRIGSKVLEEISPVREEMRALMSDVRSMIGEIKVVKTAEESSVNGKKKKKKTQKKKGKKASRKPNKEEVEETLKSMGLGGEHPGELSDD